MKNRYYRVLDDCLCEGYVHELMNYPRKDLVEKKVRKGDIVEFVEEWTNFYGSYWRVQKDGVTYDLPKSFLKPYSRDSTI